MSLKRTVVVEGEVVTVGREKIGSPVGIATLDFGDLMEQLMHHLNAVRVPIHASFGGYGAPFTLRAADPRWLGKKCKLTLTIEIEP